MTDYENNEEIKIFREYLRIPTVHPDIDYEPCINFLKRCATILGLPTKTFHPVSPKHPILVMTWEGSQPELPAILLNSHTDVVPVFPEFWSHPPFAAEIDEDGKIFARGAQDMKCVGMQYLSAIKALKQDGFVPKRTIHLSYVPEEETGGIGGMKEFVDTEDFKSLNIGFSLDEGIASPTDTFSVFYAERAIWHVWFKINGSPGHGSLLLEKTAGEKARKLIDRMDDYRKTQVAKLKANSELVTADVTTVNLTILQGGVQSNVIPPQFTVVFDIRLAIDVNHAQFEAMLNKWCEEAGGDIDIEFEQKEDFIEPTRLDSENIYWNAFKGVIDELGLSIKTQVFPGGTDSRFIRAKCVPAIGFSPMNNTPVLLHDHDEFIKADTYLKGIEIYKKIIPKLALA